jgi:rhodanese-related sulfurtransferase
VLGDVGRKTEAGRSETRHQVIDVREPDEYEIAKVDGVPLLPLSQIESRFTELDPNQTYYLHCKAGVRSLKGLNFLRQQGFKYLKSVKGGITTWSEEIDSKVPRY